MSETARVRCFVGIWPPAELATRLAQMRVEPSGGLRRIDAADLHITLRFLGDVDLDQARAALGMLSFAPTPVMLGPGLVRLGPRHLVMPAGGLDSLAEQVGLCMEPVETDRSPLPFFGHLSIATSNRPEVLDAASGGDITEHFTVREVALVASTAAGYRTVETVTTST